MARQETVLSVFVASPSDVDEERSRLEEVIRELNTTWARELGIRLELVRWETHAYPSFGEDAQAIINEQIANDYDLFIGIMWYRFGTPTKRFESGTIEEFQRAKKRFDCDPTSLQLMIYFKDAPAPVAPSTLDYSHLAKIAEFRSSLGEEGGLYWSFISLEDFEKLVRLHLTRHVQSWRSKLSDSKQPELVESQNKTKEESYSENSHREDEPGLLDLMEQCEEEFVTLREIMERIKNATVEIGKKMEARTAENKEFASGPDSRNPKAAKQLIAKAAADMDYYVNKMEAELPLFSKHFNSGMNALVKATEITIEFNVEANNLEQIQANLAAVRNFCDTLNTVESQITDFREVVASLPRLTSRLNQSRRGMANVLQRLIVELHGGQVLAREAETSFASMIEQN